VPRMSSSRLEAPRPSIVTELEEPEETVAPPSYQCDACARSFEGSPGGAGLLVWTRGEEVRYEEPPLCEECAQEITIGALLKWDGEEEEEG
jgi:hypothetical protein